MSKAVLIEISGWFGAIAILAAYLLNSLGILDSLNLGYQMLNLFGAGAISLSSISKKDIPAGTLNVIWTIIAAIAILKIILKF